MSFLIELFARWGVAGRLLKPLGYLTAILSVCALAGLSVAIWLHFHDRGVIDDHESVIDAKVTIATSAANDFANANDAERRANEARADEQLRGVIADATAKHPEEVRRDAGPAVSRTLDELRRRQAQAGAAAGK